MEAVMATPITSIIWTAVSVPAADINQVNQMWFRLCPMLMDKLVMVQISAACQVMLETAMIGLLSGTLMLKPDNVVDSTMEVPEVMETNLKIRLLARQDVKLQHLNPHSLVGQIALSQNTPEDHTLITPDNSLITPDNHNLITPDNHNLITPDKRLITPDNHNLITPDVWKMSILYMLKLTTLNLR